MLYEVKSFKVVFPMREPQVPTFQQKMTSKYQIDVKTPK